MEDLDLKLKLFSGLPIEASGYGMIDPLKVRDVINYGYTDYVKCLNIMNIEKEELFNLEGEERDKVLKELEGISTFSILIAYGDGDDTLKDALIESLSFFLGGEAIFDEENMSIIIKIEENDYRVISNDNYENVKDIIKWQNYLKHFSEEESSSKFNPANEKVRKMKERMEALNKKVSDIKNKNEDGEGNDIDFCDIMSAISSKSNSINEINILDMTIYQIYSKFKRLEVIDEYDIGIKSMLAGASNVKLAHWSKKTD